MITPKATMQQKSVSSAPTVEPKKTEEPKTEEKKDSDEIEMEP